MNFSHMPRFINTNISVVVVVGEENDFGRCRLLKFLLSFHRDNFSLGINWEFEITIPIFMQIYFISEGERRHRLVDTKRPTEH